MNATPQTWDALADRLARLERANRRYRLALTAAVGLLGVGVLAAAQNRADKPEAVEASRFVLRSADGKVAAALENGPNGPRLALIAADGDGRAFIGLNKGSPTILLRDKADSKQFIIGVADDETAIVVNDRGVKRLVLATEKDGDALLIMNDREGRMRTALSGLAADAGLTVFDLNKKKRAQLVNGSTSGPKLLLADEDGKPVFSQPTEGR